MARGRVLIQQMQSALHPPDRVPVPKNDWISCQNSLSRVSMFAIRSGFCFEKVGEDVARAGEDRCDTAWEN